MPAYLKLGDIKGESKSLGNNKNGFIKLGDIKGESKSAGNILSFQEIKVTYSLPEDRSKLLNQGFSTRGVDELVNGVALSDPNDRHLSASLIGSLLL